MADPDYAGAPSGLRVKAILLLALAMSAFGVMDGLGKLLAADYSVAQVIWARYAFAVPVILAVAGPGSWRGLLKSGRPSLQACRALLPLLSSVTVVLGLTMMPLADFTAISFAAPLVVVALSAPLLGERISVHSWMGVACGFVGVLVIVRPGAGTLAWAAFFPLATALMFAVYQLMTRLVSRGDEPIATLGWTILVGLLLAMPFLPIGWRDVAAVDWLLLGLSGILFGLGHFLLIRAFAMAPAAVLTPFTYVQIVAAIAFGVVVFGDVPDRWTLIGTALIIVAGIYVLRRQAAET